MAGPVAGQGVDHERAVALAGGEDPACVHTVLTGQVGDQRVEVREVHTVRVDVPGAAAGLGPVGLPQCGPMITGAGPPAGRSTPVTLVDSLPGKQLPERKSLFP